MKIKVLLSVALMIGLVVLNFYMHQIVAPEQATELALQQMNEDGSREKLRAVEHASNWIVIGAMVFGIAGIGSIWRKSLKKVLKRNKRSSL
jgi:hypothetical protein